jgi:GNAT superfamily N-acetyltransferase
MLSGDVELRSLEVSDTAAVLAVFAGLSPRSRELRFLGPKPRLTPADVHRLTSVDQRDHVAVLASSSADHRSIAIARFIRDKERPGTAEVAVEVVDAWQNRGVGTLLLGALVRRAVQVGVRRFTLLVSTENAAVLRMLRRRRGALSRVGIDHGVVEYAVSLEGELP